MVYIYFFNNLVDIIDDKYKWFNSYASRTVTL